jgi:hypothetical protein
MHRFRCLPHRPVAISRVPIRGRDADFPPSLASPRYRLT